MENQGVPMFSLHSIDELVVDFDIENPNFIENINIFDYEYSSTLISSPSNSSDDLEFSRDSIEGSSKTVSDFQYESFSNYCADEENETVKFILPYKKIKKSKSLASSPNKTVLQKSNRTSKFENPFTFENSKLDFNLMNETSSFLPYSYSHHSHSFEKLEISSVDASVKNKSTASIHKKRKSKTNRAKIEQKKFLTTDLSTISKMINEIPIDHNVQIEKDVDSLLNF